MNRIVDSKMVELETIPEVSQTLVTSDIPMNQSDNQQIVENLIELQSKLLQYKNILSALERDKTTRENERNLLR